MIGKKVLLVVFSTLLANFVFSQQLSISGFAPDTYGSGGSITVPVSLQGCFALNNNFTLYLSDANGNFNNPAQIGSYSGFYTDFINGVLPAGIPAGNKYKVRVVSSNPALTVESGFFSISGSGLAAVTNPIASASNTINDTTFGRCLVTGNTLLTVQEVVPPGYTLIGLVKDNSGSNVSATVSATQIAFTMVPGNYYTLTVKLKNNTDGSVSSKSFLVLATTNNLSLQTSGATDICLPDTKEYTINVTGNGGIRNNYPGTKYSIEWGDGAVDTYTHCELVSRNGLLKHDYDRTSCGQAPISDLNPVQYNAFRVNVRASNVFCPSSFTSITTYSKVWQKPKADFINPVYGCLNTPITFPNTSQNGLSGYNNVVNCIDVATYEWYVDGVLIFNAPKSLVYTFTTTGYHTVRLVAVNDPCSDEVTKQICIEEPLNPNFKINGQDSLAGCAPLDVTISNLTTFGNGYQCRPVKLNWSVVLRASMQPGVLGVDYTIQPNDSATNPTFTFLKPGQYYIRLMVANACGTHYKDLPVTITDIAGVSFNFANKRYCGLKTIDFGTDPNHRPTYNSNSGSENYKWTVSGGTYSFTGGTSNTSAYPKIQFNEYKTYTISLQFNNSCGTKTAVQQITFDSSVTATTIHDTTLCNNATLIQLNGSSTGTSASASWSVVNGSGTFSASTIANPTYTFSSGDRAGRTVTLRYTVNPVAGSVCASASDDVVITLLANNVITSSSTKNVCTGASVNYTPAAAAGSVFSWTSTIVSGSVTGNSANGTGSITDVLVNASATQNAVVKYTITPLANGCNGQVFNLLVTVVPLPDLQITPVTDSICTGTATNFSVSSSYSSAYYKWTAAVTAGSVTGLSNQTTAIQTNKIAQILINTGSTFATVTYTVTAYGTSGSCPGETKTVTVVVRPGATVANAGIDQLLCNQSSATLAGNNPAVGAGVWKQIAGPMSNIVNVNTYNTVVNGLVGDTTYKYVWTITGTGQCASTSDTVVIKNRPAVTKAIAGNNLVVCDFDTTGTVTLSGNENAGRSYESHQWTILGQPVKGNGSFSDATNPLSTFGFKATGVYKLLWTIANDAGCPATSDTVIINVFPKPVAGPITGNTNICVGNDVSVTLTSYSGNILKWQYHTVPVNDNNWRDTLVTSSKINFLSVSQSFAVRAIVQSVGASFGCTSTDTTNVLLINASPSTVPGTTGPSDTVCINGNNGKVTVTGNTGKIDHWEYSDNNGTTWNTIADSSASITYNNLTVTTLYRAVIVSGNCGAIASLATKITVLDSVTQAKVGADKFLCGTTTTLQGNAFAKGEYAKWKQISGPSNATLNNDSDSSVTASGLVAGVYQFAYTLSNGKCNPTVDSISITVLPQMTIANAGNDILICDFSSAKSVSLKANADTARSFEKHQWSVLSQPANSSATFSDSANPESIFRFNKTGAYQLLYTISNNAGCPPSGDTVNILVFERPVAGPITADINICVGNDVLVTLASHTGNIKKWQYNPAPVNDNLWKDTVVNVSAINFANVTDTFAVRVIVESAGAYAGCNETDTSNVIIINAAPVTVAGTTGSDAVVCKTLNKGKITLTGNIGKIIRWEFSTDKGATWTIIADTSSSINYNNLAVTTMYRAVVESGHCGIKISSATTITVAETVTQAIVGADQLICGTSTVLEGNAPAQGERGKWTQISGAANALFNYDTASVVSVSSLVAGKYQFVWTLSNGTCNPTADTITVTVRPAITVANAGNDEVVCDFVTTRSINLNAGADATRAFENHEWKIISQPANGNGVISNITDPAATFTFGAPGTYQLLWTISNDAGCPPTKDTVTISVFEKPFVGRIAANPAYCGTSDVVVALSAFKGQIKKWQYNPAPISDNLWRDTIVTTPSITFLAAKDTFAVRVIVEAVSANNVCTSSDTSNVLIVNITPTTVPGITGPADTVCFNNNHGIITLSGNVGRIIRWEYSEGSNWIAINDTTASVTYNNLITTTTYRAIVQSGSCGVMPSSVTVINVLGEVSKANAGVDQLICNSSTQLEGNQPNGGERGEWRQISGPGTATLSATTSPSVNAYNLVAGIYQFVWNISNGACSPTADTMVVVVRPAMSPANAGDDILVCDFVSASSVKLNATNPNSGRTFETKHWRVISAPVNGNAAFSDESDAKAIFNYAAGGTYLLEWSITNDAGCTPTKDTVVITVVQKPVAGKVTPNTVICFGSNVSVNMGTYTGVIKKWQYNTAPINDNIWIDTLITAANINFLKIADTFSVRAIVQSKGAALGCLSEDTSNAIIINVVPSTIPGTTGPVDTVCKGSNDGNIVLKGNNGKVVRWEYSEDNGTTWIAAENVTTGYNYSNLARTTWFRAVVENGTCGSIASSYTQIVVRDFVTPAVAGPAQVLCAVSSTSVKGNFAAAGEKVKWSQIKGSPVVFSADTSANSTISNLVPGSYSFVYTITNGICPATTDTVNITVRPAIINTIDTVGKTICSGQAVTIKGDNATGGNGKYEYQWQSSTDGITWINLNGEYNSSLKAIPSANVYFRRLVNSLPCTAASDPVLITVQQSITNNTINSNQNICLNTAAAQLNGSLPAGGSNAFSYEWEQSVDSGKTWVTIPNSNSRNFNPGAIKVTTSYRRNIHSNYCIDSLSVTSNLVTVVVNPDTKAGFTYSKNISCPPFTIDSLNIKAGNQNAANASYQWFANGKLIGNGLLFPGYTMTAGNDSVAIRLVTVSNFGCKDDTAEHRFYTNITASQPAFSIDNAAGCGPLKVAFTNQTPNINSFTYKWNFGNGLTSTAANPGSILFKSNPEYSDTIYRVSLTVYSTCDSLTYYKDIKVRSAAQALFKPDRMVGCSPLTVTFTNYSQGANDFTWNFGDGAIVNTTEAGSIKHTFTSYVQDTFRVSLIARSECGSDTQYYSIVVSPVNIRLVLTVNGDQKSGCSPHIVQLINNSRGATSFRWDLGDGNILTTARNIDTITHAYTNPGTYNIKLAASNGCSDTATAESVTVYAKPVVDFALQPSTVCIGDTVRFKNLSDTITGLTWNFGDGTLSNLVNPKHKYNAPGIYTVTLIGVRQFAAGNACVDSTHKTATVISSLPGSFAMSDSVGNCTPFTVTFTNNNLPSKSTVWDFGDGKKDTGDIVKHTFLSNGSFNVTMVATHPGGCTYKDNHPVLIKGPAGSFVYENAVKCDNSPVRFKATFSGVDSLKWEFGDGTTVHSTNDVAFHTYPKAGNYVPYLTLYAGAACHQRLPGTDTIRVDFIKAGFKQSMISDCGITNVSFRDTSRAFTNVVSCAWKFGDGVIDSAQHPTHQYRSASTWMVQLISTSKYGCADTATKAIPVTINLPPIANISGDTVACANSRISYSSSVISTDTVLSYRWSFSNGFSTNGTSVNNVYANAGRYKATLIVSTVNGCLDTVSKSITINPNPAMVATKDQSICPGQSVQLTVAGGNNYVWGPSANLSCLNCTNPIATPANTTRYIVKGSNSFGCVATDTVNISVAQPFKIKSSLNDTICIGQTTQLYVLGADKYKWTPSAGLNKTDVSNPLASPSLTTNYRVVGTDSNSCFSDTAYITVAVGKYPTVDVGPGKVLSSGTLFPIKPVVTNGPIRKWEWYPAHDLSCNDCGTPTVNIKKDITYLVTATNDYGCKATDTISFKVFCESAQVYIPNVFTPDGDGVNDILMVRGTGINTVKQFRIFNRWGEVVFEKANFSPNEKSNGWDGTVRGSKAPTDVYVYTCEVTCENGNSFVYKGNVAIIK